ncbi:HAMP domain-containing sensor histidine kinase [Schinkia azotoformans]|uniref:histidine kinase n=1 Tax=Schinkia azotoformans LMG 9581 TaxID=1131731 RepID=K6DHG0_SCHAZ|nr:HAMP domain-containing sensor histidine kinase [Schinkia azotoformans]EKN67754.1 two-component sensor histidine kinase [Schinkia azotoformans LMG 9581]MEC1637476.1 HAMP domain-containing sensor histidine kinase [Schinkia azotoformans]MEC1718990.1 HAMP domain-containing sensor histidine kinase [Schinkia azotoformans]MEC1943880.1 HAMP domain-containing sensor histidine kinase [Schinkia azotoformans]MED4411980.1 HAMP domain-containing sensor histidine kinase [Schinkia azotoformans]
MKWKLTGRYLLSVVLVVILVIFMNLFLGIALLVAQSTFDSPLFQERETSPEQFTRRFQKEIIINKHGVTITEKGQKELVKKKAWIQILDENGKEIYSFEVPATIKKKYTPSEMIQMYKYKEVGVNTVVYIGEKKKNGLQLSYLIGIENRDLNRYIISYNNRDILIATKIGMAILLIDILIALLIGYLFSKRLTQPLNKLIEDIKKLANHEFEHHTESRGLYKNVFDHLNHLSDQLKVGERERKKLDAMREEWIANISHDIKTPLSSIQGYAEMIKDPDYDFTLDEMREYAGIIEVKSLYIKEVMEDLNLTTRLKNKELSLNKKAVNIVAFLRKIVIDLLNDPKYADRDIQFHVNQETIMVEIDEILFRRAINNLIYNAIVHNEHNVKIIVSVEKDEYTNIMIKDNGKGIKKEELDRIFDRYYRGTNTGAAHRGSGLGMAIANDIIKVHDGRILIHSEVGYGTTIDIQI